MKSLTTLLIPALLLMGCGKEEVDPTSLTSNPFDPAYNGAAIFELIGQQTTSYVEDGETFYRHEQNIRVRTDLLPAGANFTVQEAGSSIPVGNDVDTFTRVVDPATPGTQYCKTYQLMNGGGLGADNAVCTTATL